MNKGPRPHFTDEERALCSGPGNRGGGSVVPSDHPSTHPPAPQVKSGTIFDNFLITNDEAYAEEFGNETWGVTKVGPGSDPGLGGGQVWWVGARP